MTKRNHRNKTSAKKKKTSFVHKRRPKTLTFDPEARREYLCGFSKRKQERRAFGWAMQHVKDRTYKLQDRQTTRQAKREQIEQAERQKQELLEQQFYNLEEDETKPETPKEEPQLETVQEYQDETTTQQWGGRVTVTTSTVLPGDDDEEEEPILKFSVDKQQRWAGKVEKFLKQKHKPKAKTKKRKGKYGAANMRGMGSDADLKLARKALAKTRRGKPKR